MLGYDFNSWFIDYDATGEIYDYYSKKHITTHKEDLNARLERMSYIRDKEKIFIDPSYSLPSFRLVYNDSVVTSYHWLWGTFKIEDEVENKKIKEVLYNTPPMYHIDRNEWDKNKDKIVSHTKLWSEFNNINKNN